MTLQESIRKVLREEFKLLPFVKRRLNYVNEYIDALIPSEVCEYWTVDEVDEYVNGAMSEIVRNIIDYSSGITSDEYSSVYDGIYEVLVNLNYPEQIGDFFYDSMDKYGKVLKEETLRDSLRDLIKSDGIKKASKAVGGFKRLIKILDLNEQELYDIIYQYLTEEYYPDYNWGPELHDFYREDVKRYGLYNFEINDLPAYTYLGEWDGYEYLYTLYVNLWIQNELNSLFGDLWVDVFIEWFENNSGLEVKEIDLEGRYVND
jgi:hypothetical protein